MNMMTDDSKRCRWPECAHGAPWGCSSCPVQVESELSMDARALLTGWFGFGRKTSVEVGGFGARRALTPRSEAAMQELIDAGYVTAARISPSGRMKYAGTGKQGQRLSLDEMQTLGKWNPTEPGPSPLGPRRNDQQEKMKEGKNSY